MISFDWFLCFSQRCEESNYGLSNFRWLYDALPDADSWNQVSSNLKSIKNYVSDSKEIGNAWKMTYPHQFDFINLSLTILCPQLKEMSKQKLTEWWQWSGSRFGDAMESVTTQIHPKIESKFIVWSHRNCKFNLSCKNERNTHFDVIKVERTFYFSFSQVHCRCCLNLHPMPMKVILYNFHIVWLLT